MVGLMRNEGGRRSLFPQAIAAFVCTIIMVTACYAGSRAGSIAVTGSSGHVAYVPDEQWQTGRLIYATICAACHGAALEGTISITKATPPWGEVLVPPLGPAGKAWRHPDQVLYGIVRYGERIMVRRTSRFKMPSHRFRLTEADTWAVLKFVKSSWSEEMLERQAEFTRRLQRLREQMGW